ncbi:MAG TPA: stalk domain-containing protein [Candidatus Baltobacteraceae bacterium]|nr:stalk domain-containing protein [Candidatus Baltobacteraceae bacterium]
MIRLSTGVLTSLIVASLGLSAVAAPSGHASPGNFGTNVIAQATPAASPMASMAPAATPMASPAGAATPMASAAPAAPSGGTAPSTPAMPPMQFGSPPSGEIPILFNDHHVYSKPDVLKQGRVLAALVRGGTILVPLRSMFEQMGATVSYDPGSKTVDVTKQGADVKVTLGSPQVTINGETRPLDVPPMMYHGQILVPVRVISEGMGAYVQWVPDRRVVVVRYLPPTPPPPPAPPPPAVTPGPTATPAPAAKKITNEVFVAGDYLLGPKVYNEFDPGVKQPNDSSYAARAAVEFNLLSLPWMVEGDYRQWGYQHNTTAILPANTPCTANFGVPAGEPGCVTLIGGVGQVYVPAFSPKDNDVDGRLGLKVLDPRIYIGVSYLGRWTNYGYPRQSGVGFGLEKLPDLDQAFSVYGSAYYYPQIKGTCGTAVCPTGPFDLEYRIFRYEVGATFSVPGTPVFIEGGWIGDNGKNKLNAPSDFSHNAGYVGLGIHF